MSNYKSLPLDVILDAKYGQIRPDLDLFSSPIADLIVQLTQQRDELVETLRNIVDSEMIDFEKDYTQFRHWAQAVSRAALSRIGNEGAEAKPKTDESCQTTTGLPQGRFIPDNALDRMKSNGAIIAAHNMKEKDV